MILPSEASFHKRTAVSVALVVYLASYLAFLPLVQVLHLAFADHDHLFCQTHHRVEDVPQSSAGSAAQPGRWITSTGPGWATNPEDPRPFGHVTCSVLNHSVAREPLALPDQQIAASPLSACGPIIAEQHESCRPGTLLYDAPKTSPPPTVA